MKRIVGFTLVLASLVAMAAPRKPGPTIPANDGLFNAAQTTLGATATVYGAPTNKGWPANNAIPAEDPRNFRSGVLFGAPMEGGTVDVNLVLPCDIERLDLMQLDYHGTMNVKTAEVLVDGKKVATLELPENPGYYQSFPVKAHGAKVSIKCVATHPRMKLADGKEGTNYGGWARIRVLVKDDIATLMAAPSYYQVAAIPNAVALSGCAKPGEVKVYGEPRQAKGHPCTAWDSEDVKRLQAMMKTSPVLKQQAEALRRSMDKRITQPIQIPQPKQNAAGEWIHVSDTSTGKIHNALALDIANLGAVYQLFGDEKYADFCKKMLLAYADAWPKYGVGARPGFSHDPSKVFDQRLGDSTWLLQVAVGYDCIHDWKGITPAEREHIEKDLVAGSGDFIRQNSSVIRSPTNWSAISTAAILMAGYACDDEDLIKTGLFGVNYYRSRAKTPPNEWWKGTPNANPSGVELHFSEKTIDVDGMWSEGAMGYQFMALQALIIDAEMCWHHGIDLYRYRNGALKRIFDSPLYFAYPNLISPAIHDSGNASIVGREAYLYEYGYWRYRDPKYMQVLRQVGRRLAASFQQFTVSTLFDLDPEAAVELTEPESVNLNGVGYGILRVTDGEGTRSLLVDYGPNRSHGHPDKLNIDLWAFGELQVPDPGSAWYETPIYRNWFRTTFAHNTINVDMQEQQPCGAELLVYAPGDQYGLERARTDGAYSGVTMDRSLFMTKDYVADLYGVFGKLKRTYDLAWHPRGECLALPEGMRDFPLPEPRSAGYSELKDLKSVKGTAGGKAVFDNHGRKLALILAGGEATEFVAGKATIGQRLETPIFERRVADSTIYGNVVDLSNRDYVKTVKLAGGVKDGWAELEIATADSRDYCYAAFGPTSAKGAKLATDAQQAYVSLDAKGQLRAMVLGGGTGVKFDRYSLKANLPCSVAVERTETGSYLVKSCAPVAIEVTLLVGTTKNYSLAPGEVAEYLPAGAKPIAEHRKAVLAKLAAEAAAAEAKAKAERAKRTAARQADAAKYMVPADFCVAVQAEDFVAEGEGNVKVSNTKTAVVGSSFAMWDADGQWLDWKVTVPVEGYYAVTLCYCCDSQRQRKLAVNGVADPDGATSAFAATGGFANGSDDWRLAFFADPEVAERPMVFKFKAGENVVRMANVGGGGLNLDYFFVHAPAFKPARLK